MAEPSKDGEIVDTPKPKIENPSATSAEGSAANPHDEIINEPPTAPQVLETKQDVAQATGSPKDPQEVLTSGPNEEGNDLNSNHFQQNIEAEDVCPVCIRFSVIKR